MSARVRDAFRARGHSARSCDLLPTLGDPRWHFRGDVFAALESQAWDLMIAFPPCTDLSSIGAGRWAEKQADGRQQAALDFVQRLMDAPVPRIAIENPVGRINTAIRKPDQIIQPYMFGDPWTKRTCLWLKGLPLLVPDHVVETQGHWVDGGTRVKRNPRLAGLQFGGEKFGSHNEAARKQQRSLTFPGIARAMAEQWG
jgi:hypothetical protein